MMTPRSREGVASVIGTMLFVLVLMLAIGAQSYMSNLQAQSQQMAQQQLTLAEMRGAEKLSYSSAAGSVSVASSGPTTVQIVQLVMRFANGTVYDLPANSVVPSGASLSVQPLVGGSCGSTSCQKRYSSIVSGASLGSIGLLTSYGNTFWYIPSQSASTSQGQTYWTSSLQSTTSSSFVPVTGLSFTGSQNARYQVTMTIGYYQTAASSPGVAFAISIPNGATVFGCGAIIYPVAPPGCVSKPNSAIGATVFPGTTFLAANYCANSNSPCVYSATVSVTFSGSGTFQVEFSGSSSSTANVLADSLIAVVQD
jgi:hypothetical protein